MPQIYLVVMFMFGGHSVLTLEETKQPSVTACLLHSAEMLEKAQQVRAEDGWWLSAACQVRKELEEPANNQEKDK